MKEPIFGWITFAIGNSLFIAVFFLSILKFDNLIAIFLSAIILVIFNLILHLIVLKANFFITIGRGKFMLNVQQKLLKGIMKTFDETEIGRDVQKQTENEIMNIPTTSNIEEFAKNLSSIIIKALKIETAKYYSITPEQKAEFIDEKSLSSAYKILLREK